MAFDSVIAYTTDGETYCFGCVRSMIGNDSLVARGPNSARLDSNGIPQGLYNLKGEKVGVSFMGEESDVKQSCGSCQEELEGFDILATEPQKYWECRTCGCVLGAESVEAMQELVNNHYLEYCIMITPSQRIVTDDLMLDEIPSHDFPLF